MIEFYFTRPYNGTSYLKPVKRESVWKQLYFYGLNIRDDAITAIVHPNMKFTSMHKVAGYEKDFNTLDGAQGWLWAECEKINYPIPVSLVHK